MDKQLVNTFSAVSETVKIYRVAPTTECRILEIVGSDIVVKFTESEAVSYSSVFADVLSHFVEYFPEVPLAGFVLDHGVASVQLIDRVGGLRGSGIPITIVDIFELMSPIAITAECAFRLYQGEHVEDF